jgi:pilus assembly protein CpaE
MSRFVLVTDDSAFVQKVHKAVAGGLPGSIRVSSDTTLAVAPPDLVDAPRSEEPTEVLVLGPGVAFADALRFASISDVQVPEVSVVLVADTDPEFALPAMRAGIRDILAPAADVETVRVLLERACRSAEGRAKSHRPHQAVEEHGRAIVVASPKGGVGKTTIATNLALALAAIAPMSTVLVDLDAQFGDVAHALQLEPENSLIDAVSRAAKEDSMVLKAFLTVHHGSIYVLTAPPSPASADSITGEDISHLISQLLREFRFVVIDTAPGLGEHTLAALESSTHAVLVCGMDVPSVRGLRVELDILNELALLEGQRSIVVNIADMSTGLSIKDLESTLGAPVDVVIPRSKEVAISTNRGVPIMQPPVKRSAASKAVARLADRFDPRRPVKERKGLHKRAEVLK